MMQACGALGITVLAEGIESEEELLTLRRMGCELFQGFLFGRPKKERVVPVGFSG
jgi:EAL domain-containing protein (putative c-di-GMP-specific phosphodiesterase class I)